MPTLNLYSSCLVSSWAGMVSRLKSQLCHWAMWPWTKHLASLNHVSSSAEWQQASFRNCWSWHRQAPPASPMPHHTHTQVCPAGAPHAPPPRSVIPCLVCVCPHSPKHLSFKFSLPRKFPHLGLLRCHPPRPEASSASCFHALAAGLWDYSHTCLPHPPVKSFRAGGLTLYSAFPFSVPGTSTGFQWKVGKGTGEGVLTTAFLSSGNLCDLLCLQLFKPKLLTS